ncbi:alpha-ketoglutaric semialdehyde dehydrogenase GucD [Halobacillus sp. H74]|uniref:alpha-ketoglutaric semialdehyde dehydrogenase GucD n=1 Tax=Halobacillus sp. H74 TaxID=3457436 RepID=UPI003FCED2F1
MDMKNFINGVWTASASNQTTDIINPGNLQDKVGTFQDSTEDDLQQAIQSAKEAKTAWRKLSGAARGQYLYKAAEILEKKADEVAEIATREMGKTLAETKGETARGVAILRYYAGEGMREEGNVIPSTDPDALMFTKRSPLGVVGVITPWNFPIAIPLWKAAPALIYGNTVVIKPASESPITFAKIAECFEEAELPAGVLNVVTGKGSLIGNGLSTHKDIDGITFTGSNAVGRTIGANALQRGAKYQLEMGGKNPVIIAKDADLEAAADATISGAFKSTGQKCTATSRVIIHQDIYEEFKQLLVEKTQKITVGDSLEKDVWMGPCASRSQLDNALSYIEKGKEEGAELLCGGKQIEDSSGYYLEPTIFDQVNNKMTIAQEEIFGPVIALMPFSTMEGALDIANDVDYGLSAAIFTTNVQHTLSFIDDMDAGLVRVNAESAGVELQAPFGGMKQSSSHSREQGKAAQEFFTDIKTVFVK